jgi:UDP-2,3-diacylglucosamine pyrophosphatase LpxH
MIVKDLFCLLSDLHGEFLDTEISRLQLYRYIQSVRQETPERIDTVVLAGDIAPAFHPCLPLILREIRRNFSRVIYIPGNHEFYQVKNQPHRGVVSQMEKLKELCLDENIILLDRGCVELTPEIILLGCTLWFDVDETLQDKCMLNDRFQIFENDDKLPFNPKEHFDRDVKWLEDNLSMAKREDKRVIIVTHHLPFGKPIFDYIQRPPISYPFTFRNSAGFSTDLSHIFIKYYKTIEGWCFGHTHTSLSFKDIFTGCYFFANPYGYPSENNHKKQI